MDEGPQVQWGPWVDKYEAAELLGLAPHTVANLLVMGALPGAQVRLGRQRIWMVHREEIAAYQQARDARRAQIARGRAGSSREDAS